MEGSGVDFGSDADHHADCPIRNPTITYEQIAVQWYKGQFIQLSG